MNTRSLFQTIACLAALVTVSACIPIRNDVTLNGSLPQMSATPLGADEGIAVIGWGGPPDETSESFLLAKDAARHARARWRSGERMAACVRDAVADSSRPARIVQPDEIGPASADFFGARDTLLSDEKISDVFRSATTSSSFAALRARYVVMVGGSTQTSGEWHSHGGGMPVGAFGHKKRTYIRADIWDAIKGTKLESLWTDASGAEEVLSAALVINFWNYAPTESTACKDMADKILNHLSIASASPPA